MALQVGIWIDHQKAVIVNISNDHVTATTRASAVRPHPHFAGSQEGGGEKKYEERYADDLDRYYDDVISQLGGPHALFLFGPGEAKLQLKQRLGRSKVFSRGIVTVESADKLTEPQIVAKVKEHFGVAR